MIGRVLSDRYRIDDLIATGSFGAVYLGAHLHMRKQVAIKVLHPEIENFPELVERFEREAVAGAHISHPNVAVASDLGKFDSDSYFLVQEYVPGETLREVINRGPLPAVRAAFIARQIAAGLGAAHRHHIVHRDLKPLNVMLVEDSDDFVKLIDWGFARVPIEDLPHVPQGDDNPAWEMSQAGVVFGSVAYMAPDAALGMRNVDERSDLYALGVIFYEMLAGKHPFDVDTLSTAELFDLQRHATPPPIHERNPDSDVTPELEAIVRRLLAKAPEDRFQDANGVVTAIDEAMRGVDGYLGRRRSDRPPPRRKKPESDDSPAKKAEASVGGAEVSTSAIRTRALGGAIATIGILAAGIVVVLHVSKTPEPPPAASESASAPAPASVAPPPPAASSATGESFDRRFARDLQGKFLSQADQEKTDEPARTWLLMMEADPKAIDDADVQKKTSSLLTRADPDEESTKKVIYQLAYKGGSSGLDVLYRVIEDAPTSPAAMRVDPILGRQLSSDRVSPALRVTLDLRRMNCSRKMLLFDRAAKDGDDRTLRELDKLRAPNCRLGKGICCFKDNLKLEKAIAEIEDRQKK